MLRSPNSAYRYALCFCGAFTLLHAVSLPVLVTYDGHLYVELADVIGSKRFPAEWDLLRTPLYPLALKFAFWLLGEQPMAVIVVGSVFGFVGIWALGAAMKGMGHPRAAAVAIVAATLYPALVVYEHSLLTEAGTFCFVALLVRLLVWNPKTGPVHLKAAALACLLTAGYYFRPSLLYLAPIAGAVHAFWMVRKERPAGPILRRVFVTRAGIQLGLIVLVPFLLALPWNRAMSRTSRGGDVLLFGLIKQAAIPPGDVSLGSGAGAYETGIREATINGHFDFAGLDNGTQLQVWGAMPLEQQRAAGGVFWRVVRQHPLRYLNGVLRTMLLFSGLPARESDNGIFANKVLRSTGAAILPGPARLEETIRSHFGQTTGDSIAASFLRLVQPLYDVLVFLGFVLGLAATVIGFYRADVPLLSFSLVPIAFMFMHALLLLSLDRYAFPVYPILIAGLASHAPRLFPRSAQSESREFRGAPVAGWSERRVFLALAVALAFLAIAHVLYLTQSRMLPSWDEAHYLSGAVQVSRGIRTGSVEALWLSYVTALIFKPPLLTIPAAALMSMFGEGIRLSMMSLVLIFVGIGVASWSLFRNILSPAGAATAAVLLSTAPMVTGLVHRFYVENLLLFLVIIYLDILVRRGFKSVTWSALAGAVLGLGVLAKQTFLLLLFVPSCYLLYDAIRAVPRPRLRESALICARATVILVAGAAVAVPWYGRNWRAVFEHSRTFFWAESCTYPNVASFFANISSGPYLFVFLLGAAGCVRLIQCGWAQNAAATARPTWVALLILAGTTFVICTVSINKATRFSVTWLPAIAALATYFLCTSFRTDRPRLVAMTTAVVLSILLMIHNSFAILPVPAVKLGDLKILDSRYSLNVPDWFEDNHPVDRRDFQQREVERLIASDATRIGLGVRPEVRLTVDSLLVTHDLMNLLSMLQGMSAAYSWWPGTESSGLRAPDYVIQPKGFDRFYPGRRYVDYVPQFEADVAANKLPYRPIARILVPDGAEFLIFRNKRFDAVITPTERRQEPGAKAHTLPN